MKVVFISGMLPSGHYSQYLTYGLVTQEDIDLIIYTDKDQKNLEIKDCGNIKLVWSKSIKYIYEIIREILGDKPDIIHIQHEINMFGSVGTALIFPLLIFSLRILGYKVITTVHGVVGRKQVNNDFIDLFLKQSLWISPFFVKIFFFYLFWTIPFFSNTVIVHTKILKKILISDYWASRNKIDVIPTAIPQKNITRATKKKYFIYFGYMVRRKGLSYVLEGFKKFIDSNPDTEYKLVMAGGVIKGQEQAFDDIKQEIKKNNLTDRVKILGFIEEKDLDELYGNAYAVVIPAKISVAASGPLYHAVSYGKCVIVSKVGNFLEEIEHLTSGILTENEKWHESLKFAIENPDIVEQIERNNELKSKVRTPLATAKRCIDLYRTIIT